VPGQHQGPKAPAELVVVAQVVREEGVGSKVVGGELVGEEVGVNRCAWEGDWVQPAAWVAVL
jgi:hypothetical protein